MNKNICDVCQEYKEVHKLTNAGLSQFENFWCRTCWEAETVKKDGWAHLPDGTAKRVEDHDAANDDI